MMLSAEEVQQYHADGYLIKRQFFSREESQRLLEKSRSDKVLQESAIRRDDKDGRTTKLTVWNHPIDDLYGMFSRNKRLVTAVEQLMGEPVYHYHSKIMLKEPRVGGAWEWHQDYGYWYKNGCLYPLMLSAMIAIDRATTDNGCLQVLKVEQVYKSASTAASSFQCFMAVCNICFRAPFGLTVSAGLPPRW
eukprot:scpid41607/ scgid0505/ Ectoine hydroxylase